MLRRTARPVSIPMASRVLLVLVVTVSLISRRSVVGMTGSSVVVA